MTKDPWVRVKDQGELRDGMAIKTIGCLACGKGMHIGVILCRGAATLPCEDCGACPGWCNSAHRRQISTCQRRAIREGRLYRLADDQLADDAETTTVAREREIVE